MEPTNTPSPTDQPGEANTPNNPNPSQTGTVVKVGGREYDLSTPEGLDALNTRVTSADSHIDTLTAERQKDAERLSALQNQTNISEGIQQVLNNLPAANPAATPNPTGTPDPAATPNPESNPAPAAGLDLEALAGLIAQTVNNSFQSREIASQDAAFVAEVGGDEALEAAATKVGLTAQALKDLHRTSPAAAKALVAPPTAPAAPSRGVNTAALSASPSAQPRAEASGYNKLRTVRERQALLTKMCADAGLPTL